MKKIITHSLLAVSTLSLATSLAQPLVASAQDENVEISFMIPDWGVPPEEMLADFTEETGITVNLVPTSWDDIRDRIATAAVGQTAAADVFEVDWSWTGEFVSAGWLAPIEMSQETIDDMPTLETFMVENSYYALPYANDFRIAFSNERMFKEAGIEEMPLNWATLIENARTIKEAGINDYPIAIPLGAEENATTTFLWLAYTRNGVVFNEDNTINRDALEDTLALINQLVEEELVNPANTQTTGMDVYGQIASGETAFMTGPSSFITRVEDEENSVVVGDIAASQPLSKDSDNFSEVTVPFNEAIGISAYSEQPEAALEFAEWYTSQETQEQLNAEISATPTRMSALKNVIENEEFVAIFETAETPFPNGVPEYYTEMSTAIFNSINQLATGQISVEDAANQIETAVNELAQSAND